MTGLDVPPSSGELYLARGTEVEPYRPVMTGDVFSDVAIPGVDGPPGPAMVLAHPCSMREGAHLRSHLQMAALRDGGPIALEQWTGHFGVMPLPELLTPGDYRQRAVFELAGRVPSELLTFDRRIACLSTPGILLLLQRLTFNMTRLAIDQPTLLQSIDYVLEEADLLEEWMRARLADVPAPHSRENIESNETSFDDLMKRVVEGTTLRVGLRDPRLRAGIRRAVRSALAS
jgi:hypothetical protein